MSIRKRYSAEAIYMLIWILLLTYVGGFVCAAFVISARMAEIAG